LTDVEYYLDN